MEALPTPPSVSPKWGPTAKLVVGLSIGAILLLLLIFFRNLIGPLLLVFVLVYLLHPAIGWFSRVTRLSWKASANIIFLALLVILLASLSAAGVAIITQVQNLIDEVAKLLEQLPETLEAMSTQSFQFWIFSFDLSNLELNNLLEQVLGYVQPALGRLGGLAGSFASGAAAFVGWAAFVLLISYFFLVDAPNVPDELLYVEIPGYSYDIRRLTRELHRVWNAFLRGQLIMFVLVVITYTVLMAGLGVRNAIAIAFLAGLARFVPYVGPFVTWTVTALIAFFQGHNFYGLEAWQFTLLVIGLAILVDQIFDNIVSPRIMGSTLGVHPAAVLIAALAAANLIGIIGLVLAAPVLATVALIGRYVTRKMLDLDPWTKSEEEEFRPPERKQSPIVRRMDTWYREMRKRRQKTP